MTFEAWLLFCLTEAALCFSPGPSTFVVVSQSISNGTSAGVRAATGVLAANAVYFALSAAGLVALHSLSAVAFAVIKWCGAAYLLWLGGSIIVRSLRESSPRAIEKQDTGRPLVRGFIVQGANPNLLAYFTAILPQFVDPHAPVAPQIALLAASSFVIEFSLLSAYSRLSGRTRRIAAPRFRAYVERIGGGLLIGAAAGLARIEQE